MLARRLPCGRRKLAAAARAAARAAAAVLRRPVPCLSIALVGERRMRRLNRDFHGVDAATDVLAFPLTEVGGEQEGEIVVCLPVTEQDARARGLDPLAEALLCIAHATLHLLGEKDRTGQQALRMRRLERAALRRIGWRLPAAHLLEVGEGKGSRLDPARAARHEPTSRRRRTSARPPGKSRC